MITCILCDTNPSQDCEGCGFGLPVCADCVAADEWLRCSNCTPGDMIDRPPWSGPARMLVHSQCRLQ